MLNKDGQRELAYLVIIDDVYKHPNADRLDIAEVGGWRVVVGKDELQAGELAVYFEIDSKLPEKKPFSDMEFLASKRYKVKTQKIRQICSQGLLMPLSAFDGTEFKAAVRNASIDNPWLTEALEVTYAVAEDNARKANPADKYKKMSQRHPKIFKQPWARWMMKREWGRKVMFLFFGKKRDNNKGFPTHFPGVSKTDQERIENMTWVLNDKTPYIKTQKCDGSSGTYILERKKHNKFEFYVTSRNVRQLKETQQCFYDENVYWEVAKKYNIENKLKDYLDRNPDIWFVCWQGEICSPKIQGNPHDLKETHFYCFHMTDSKIGRFDIRNAKIIWDSYNMETVPIVDTNYILPDDFEEFKASADGFYEASVCEGNKKCRREGFVYYKTTDPTFSFKNVSREYLLKHNN